MIEDISIDRGESFYLFRFPYPFRKYSSAPYGGGTGHSTGYLNRTVPSDYKCDPVTDIDEFLMKNGMNYTGLTATLTACRVENAIIERKESSTPPMMVSVTGGSSNALSIGSKGFSSQGTINIAVISDAHMDDASALNLFMAITESKSQAMNDLGIKDRTTGKAAPGTSTDTVSLFLSGNGPRYRYGGRLTDIGRETSMMVYSAVKASLISDCTGWK